MSHKMAQFLLDFGRCQSMYVDVQNRGPMRTEPTAAIVEHLTGLINLRLAAAAAKSRHSLMFRAEGRREKAIDILLDIEPLLHETRALLNTIATLQRETDATQTPK
jgi:hypothetical protein